MTEEQFRALMKHMEYVAASHVAIPHPPTNLPVLQQLQVDSENKLRELLLTSEADTSGRYATLLHLITELYKHGAYSIAIRDRLRDHVLTMRSSFK